MSLPPRWMFFGFLPNSGMAKFTQSVSPCFNLATLHDKTCIISKIFLQWKKRKKVWNRPKKASNDDLYEAFLRDLACCWNANTVLDSQYYIGVSIHGGTPKWMVYNGKSYLNVVWFGGSPIIGNPYMILKVYTIYDCKNCM